MLAEANTVAAANRTQILAALHQASAATGSDFNYLLGTAMRESSLKSQAKSDSSSASGLFQFVEQTWLGLVKEHGAKYGLGSYSNAISQGSDGHYRVDNAADRQAILALRNDPQTAALMEGEFASQCRSTLEQSLGRGVCGGELYAAHFLGPDAAAKLIRMSEAQPGANAATAFPNAAGANRSVFYHSDGTAKTVREVYNWALKQPSGADDMAAVAPAAPKPSNSYVAASASPDHWTSFQLMSAMDAPLSSLGGFGSSSSLLSSNIMQMLGSLSPDGRDSAGAKTQ
jgi:hypothetical protein